MNSYHVPALDTMSLPFIQHVRFRQPADRFDAVPADSLSSVRMKQTPQDDTPHDLYSVNGAGLHLQSPGWSWSTQGQLESWQGYLLGIVHAGSASVECPGQRHRLERGGAYFFQVHSQTYTLSNVGQDRLILGWVYFHSLDNTLFPSLISKGKNPAMLELLMGRVIETVQQNDMAAASDWLKAVLRELRHDPRAIETLDETDAPYLAGIERLCRAICAEPGKRWQLAELAEEIHVSAAHFTRLFRKYRGISPGRFLILNRMEAARHQLQHTPHSIAEIAEILGYTDAFAFSHQFKTETGMSPMAFRNRGGEI